MHHILLALLLLCAFCHSYAQADKRLMGMETLIEKTLEATNTLGCAIAIVEGDRILYAKGHWI